MKLQSLAIIFVIIIMPISIVLSEYVNNKITIAQTELTYNTRLLNSTYDAIKAYQLNTVNNAFGDITNEKVRDIEAAVNTFFNSLNSSFKYTGYKADVMKEYVPAIVFTMYDGYYIYSPFTNVLTGVEEYDDKYSKKGKIFEGLKPYVSYSARYTRGSGSNADDFIITYTLDNYITIQGKINGQYVYDYGYLYLTDNVNGISKKEVNGKDIYTYDGVEFSPDDTEELKEFVGQKEYSYVKINGKKYYLDPTHYERDEGDEEYRDPQTGDRISTKVGIFYIDEDGNKSYTQTHGCSNKFDDETLNEIFLRYYRAITKNKSAYEYYKNAYNFSKAALSQGKLYGVDYYDKEGAKIENGYNLKNLQLKHSVIFDNQNKGLDSSTTPIGSSGDEYIFSTVGNEGIENASSNFNKHRKAIIRHVVETNLITSISSFASKASNSFIMPKISETDWDIIENDVCAISFMQGMNLGSKKYNGYSVVANTLTKDYVDENDIYILATDTTNGINTNIYCKANDSILNNANVKIKDDLDYTPGVWKLNFEQKQDISAVR